LKLSEPPNACEQLVQEAAPLKSNKASAVLATESGCDLHTKIINAQDAGFKCIIIISNSEVARVMGFQPEYLWKMWKSKIYVSFIGYQDGQNLKQFALDGGNSATSR